MSHEITEDDLDRINAWNQKDHPHPNILAGETGRTAPSDNTSILAAVEKSECKEFRERALDGETAPEIAEDFDLNKTTVRRHVRGDCPHGGYGLSYDRTENEWNLPENPEYTEPEEDTDKYKPGHGIKAAICREMRIHALEGMQSSDIADIYEHRPGVIRKHLRGDCQHDGGLEYIYPGNETQAGEWTDD